MFSKLFFKAFGLHIKLSCFFGATPYHWDFKTKTLSHTRWSVLWLLLNAAYLYILCGFLTFRVIQAQLGVELESSNFTFAFFVCGLIDCGSFLLIIGCRDSMAWIISRYIWYAMDFQKKYMPNLNPDKSLFNLCWDLSVIYAVCVSIAAPCIISGHYFLFPQCPMYPTSMIPLEYFHPIIYLVFGLSYLWILISLFCSLAFVCIIWVSYCIIIAPIVANEFKANRPAYKTSDSLRTPANFTLAYRSLEVLHLYMNYCFEPAIIPLQSLFTQLALFCNVTLIMTWDKLDQITVAIMGIWTLCAMVMWTFSLQMGGWLNAKGKETLKSWKFMNWPDKFDRKHLSKFKKGCRSLGIRVGGYYCMRRLSVLKFLRGIVRGTFRALLALK